MTARCLVCDRSLIAQEAHEVRLPNGATGHRCSRCEEVDGRARETADAIAALWAMTIGGVDEWDETGPAMSSVEQQSGA